MYPGLFRENLKRVFGILATPKEIGYLMDQYDTDKVGKINSKKFMISFLSIGKHERDKKRREFLESTRQALKQAKKEEEAKLAAQWEKMEFQIEYEFTDDDFQSAVVKMREASTKYGINSCICIVLIKILFTKDKAHPAAPNLDGFSGGPVKPGEFRELMKRAFNIIFTAKELGAVVSRYSKANDNTLVDGKKFLIAFMKLGFDERARIKALTLEEQRRAKKERFH